MEALVVLALGNATFNFPSNEPYEKVKITSDGFTSNTKCDNFCYFYIKLKL